jgi:hypothetical protein
MPDAGAPKVFNNGNGPRTADGTPVSTPNTRPAATTTPRVAATLPTIKIAPVTYPKPTLDQVVNIAPIALKTAGHKPEEAFTMLGQAVGVTFTPGQDRRMQENVNVWESRAYDKLDYDLEGVNFWQAALRMADLAKISPAGGPRNFTLESKFTDEQLPTYADEMRSMRALLYGGQFANRQMAGGYAMQMNLELLVDPRVVLLSVGKLNVQSCDDSADNPLGLSQRDLKYPGVTSTGVSTYHHGAQSISNSFEVRLDNAPTTIEVFRGYVSVTVATASKPLEYAIDHGQVSDQKPHEVGEWRITASESRRPPAATRPLMGGGMGGGAPPDYEFTLTVERLKDTAPPFPSNNSMLTSFEARGASISNTGAKDPMKQEWKVSVYTNGLNIGPTNKLFIQVPTEAKEVVLPFDFRHLVIQGR